MWWLLGSGSKVKSLQGLMGGIVPAAGLERLWGLHPPLAELEYLQRKWPRGSGSPGAKGAFKYERVSAECRGPPVPVSVFQTASDLSP